MQVLQVTNLMRIVLALNKDVIIDPAQWPSGGIPVDVDLCIAGYPLAPRPPALDMGNATGLFTFK
jgi:hypothetical protein